VLLKKSQIEVKVMPLSPSDLRGIVPAVVTPLSPDDKPDLHALRRHIRSLIEEGSHGILLLGTTGEGPSMGMAERESILEAGLEAAEDVFVMVGTATPSLRDTVQLTRRAYRLGADVAVVLPPYYYKDVAERGLLDFFQRLFAEAVPSDGMVMVYHIPQVTQISLPFNLLEDLVRVSNGRLVGVKDSSGDWEHARRLCSRFPEMRVFVGTDRLLLPGLELGASGCITAGANILAPLAVAVYRAFTAGEDAQRLQTCLTAAREVLEAYQPFPASLKALLALRYGGDSWHLRAPLTALSESNQGDLLSALQALEMERHLPWLSQIDN
jgi:4-hydroxy-tetrahydrodipicolinate synthase